MTVCLKIKRKQCRKSAESCFPQRAESRRAERAFPGAPATDSSGGHRACLPSFRGLGSPSSAPLRPHLGPAPGAHGALGFLAGLTVSGHLPSGFPEKSPAWGQSKLTLGSCKQPRAHPSFALVTVASRSGSRWPRAEWATDARHKQPFLCPQ